MFHCQAAFTLALIVPLELGATAYAQDATPPDTGAPQSASAEDLAKLAQTIGEISTCEESLHAVATQNSGPLTALVRI